MFTIKAFRSYDDNTSTQDVFSCTSYQVYRRSAGNYEISMYPTNIQKDGVCFNISQREDDYDVVYIENEKGKTIETLRMKDTKPAG